MKEQPVYLAAAAFDDMDGAEAAVRQIMRSDRVIQSAVVMQADRLAYDLSQRLAALGCDVLQVSEHGSCDLDRNLFRQVSI